MRRWLATKGKYGEPPSDWALFKAAKYCNTTPWELAKQSVWWKFKAIDYLSAEAEAEEILANRK